MTNRILYKYLDIKGGMCMIGMGDKCNFPTLQFTNASQLNDPFDCHPKLIDYSNVPASKLHGWIPEEWWIKKEETDALNLRNDTWLCSLSKVNDSLLMWSHYCYNHRGICIGLDLDKIMANVPGMGVGMIYINPFVFEVRYQDIVERPKAYHTAKDLFHYQLQTKAKDWAYEQEVRLVIEKPHPWLAAFTPEQAKEAKKNRHKVWDWKEIHHYMKLSGDCFESIYFGVNTDPKEKEKIINFACTKLNPDIKLYQMKVNEDAFRLNADEINH
jgi:hypothetical protein